MAKVHDPGPDGLMAADTVPIPVELAKDTDLSWRAKGLLVELLARDRLGDGTRLQDLWDERSQWGHLREGRASIARAMQELAHAGYVVTDRLRENGRWTFRREVRATPLPGLRSAEPPRRTAVYRYYDQRDNVLYVGVTGSLPARDRMHARGSFWYQLAVRREHVYYPTRSAGLAAESEAIDQLQPVFDGKYRDDDGAFRRAQQYLINIGREDLCHHLKIRARH